MLLKKREYGNHVEQLYIKKLQTEIWFIFKLIVCANVYTRVLFGYKVVFKTRQRRGKKMWKSFPHSESAELSFNFLFLKSCVLAPTADAAANRLCWAVRASRRRWVMMVIKWRLMFAVTTRPVSPAALLAKAPPRQCLLKGRRADAA